MTEVGDVLCGVKVCSLDGEGTDFSEKVAAFKIRIITITRGLIAFISYQYLYLSDPRPCIEQLDTVTKRTNTHKCIIMYNIRHFYICMFICLFRYHIYDIIYYN